MYKEQAALKYAKGEYTLGKVDSFGQRINIEIELQGIGDAACKTSYLKSGWMIKPEFTVTQYALFRIYKVRRWAKWNHFKR